MLQINLPKLSEPAKNYNTNRARIASKKCKRAFILECDEDYTEDLKSDGRLAVTF